MRRTASKLSEFLIHKIHCNGERSKFPTNQIERDHEMAQAQYKILIF